MDDANRKTDRCGLFQATGAWQPLVLQFLRANGFPGLKAR